MDDLKILSAQLTLKTPKHWSEKAVMDYCSAFVAMEAKTATRLLENGADTDGLWLVLLSASKTTVVKT